MSWVVGDSQVDADLAKNAGLRSVIVRNGAVKGDYNADGFYGVLRIIRGHARVNDPALRTPLCGLSGVANSSAARAGLAWGATSRRGTTRGRFPEIRREAERRRGGEAGKGCAGPAEPGGSRRARHGLSGMDLSGTREGRRDPRLGPQIPRRIRVCLEPVRRSWATILAFPGGSTSFLA